eukprot:scaffold25596_cov36-Phaeocystis_antarctica.AAC.1
MIEGLSQGLKRVFRGRVWCSSRPPFTRSVEFTKVAHSRCWRMGRACGLDGPQPRPLRLRRAREISTCRL